MSIVDEQDLRQQLGRVLDAITPPDPPVSAVARRGKFIQAGRSLGIVAGMAVVAGLGLGVPSLLNGSASEVSPIRSTVMVQQACATVPTGVREAAATPGLAAQRAEPLPSAQSPAGGRPAAEIATGGCAWLKP
jgi:cell shape-determining protein MreC